MSPSWVATMQESLKNRKREKKAPGTSRLPLRNGRKAPAFLPAEPPVHGCLPHRGGYSLTQGRCRAKHWCRNAKNPGANGCFSISGRIFPRNRTVAKVRNLSSLGRQNWPTALVVRASRRHLDQT